MEDSINISKERISKIKDVCTKYFRQYDGTLKGMEVKVNSVNSTFEDWTKHVMKP
jgi:hypothetical protein